MEAIERYYRPSPTLARLHASDAFVRGVRGPIGAGKSVGCCMEIVMRASRQAAGPGGRRRSRWLVVRNTYGELRTTTIKTWQEWVPESVCPLVYDAPIRGRMVFPLADETTVDLEVLFLALDRPDQARKLLSLELTGAWINEAREIPKAILDMLTGRVGRFPPLFDGGCAWSGVIMDSNPPADDHWWYRLAEEDRPRGYQFFRQPPAIRWSDEASAWQMHPDAENVSNQPAHEDYWLRQIPGKTREWINVMLCGEYGSVETGRPVYPEYGDDIHSSETPLMPSTAVPLILAFDFGLTPSCVFMQALPRGLVRILDEAVSADMGISQFVRDIVIPRLSSRFQGIPVIVTGDPAGNQRAQTDETTCFEVLSAAGFAEIYPAPTNSFVARREAVASLLTGLSGGEPVFRLDRRCKYIRRGFLGGYHYQRLRVVGAERYKDVAEKNEYSHPHDALQYGCLMVRDGVPDVFGDIDYGFIPLAGAM